MKLPLSQATPLGVGGLQPPRLGEPCIEVCFVRAVPPSMKADNSIPATHSEQQETPALERARVDVYFAVIS